MVNDSEDVHKRGLRAFNFNLVEIFFVRRKKRLGDYRRFKKVQETMCLHRLDTDYNLQIIVFKVNRSGETGIFLRLCILCCLEIQLRFAIYFACPSHFTSHVFLFVRTSR